jgi:hypothetical protein
MKEAFSRDKTDNLRKKEDSLKGKRGQLLENKEQESLMGLKLPKYKIARGVNMLFSVITLHYDASIYTK